MWRNSGINAVVFFIIAYLIHGNPPGVNTSATELVSFYDGDSTRILIATVIFGFGTLNLLWFAASIATTLRDAGQGGWATAATIAAGALGAVSFVLLTVNATLAYSIAGSGNDSLTSGLNDVAWVTAVLGSFPAAMLIMAGSFGLWRAGILSSTLFKAGVTAVVLFVLGATTWASDGFWAPDGAYAEVIRPIVGFLWIVVITGVLVARSRSRARAPKQEMVVAQ